MKNLSFLFLLSLAAFALACQTPTTTVNSTNTNATANANTNVNANANTNVADSNMNATGSGVAIETKEPDQYQATVNLKFETLGDQKINAPALQANVARLNDNRRMEFSLPNGEKIIYLDLGGRQFVVSPARKQYAELNKEALGFEVRRLLMPGEIVNQAKTVQGVERVGEEQMNGRTVVKYRYGATTDTKTQTGNVQGVSGVRVVTEMSNLQTTADAALFAEPTDYQKVQPEQVRQQVDLLFNAAAAIIGQMMKSAATQPTVSPTP
jgi:hypothetical protein